MTNLLKAVMNRFLTRKKARDTEDGQTPPMPTSKWGKKKKVVEETPKPLDLTSALPTSDDLRTSLLMPNLSARFSMLREQDDPNSMLGKASDDSVLQPNRQSRLMGYGGRPGAALADIAEVSSITSSIRPPFAQSRQGSFSGYDTDDNASTNGSIMSRARPGEGNVLFGGRQRVYKVQMNSQSSKSLGLGKAVYEDDMHKSAFQKLRQEERERERLRQQEEQDQTSEAEVDSPRKNSFQSHSLSEYNKKRETSSSTNSGPSVTRSSTAATSIASQGPNAIAPSPILPNGPAGLERSGTKSRRLYEQSLDQDIHEQQSTVLTRLNTIHRQRTLNGRGGPLLSQTKSANNLHDRYSRRTPPSRAVSPPPSAPLSNIQNFNLAKENPYAASSPVKTFRETPPLSPFGSDSEDSGALASALNPNDRGKATAMGAFNKPAKFDENQYLQRAKQMQQGRETPPLKRESPAESPAPNNRVQPPIPQPRQPEPVAEEPQLEESPKKPAPNAFSIFQKAADQMSSKRPKDLQLSTNTQLPTSPQDDSANNQKTFFASGDDSDSEYDDEDLGPKSPQPSATQFPPSARPSKAIDPKSLDPELIHPALRPSGVNQIDPSSSYLEAAKRPDSSNDKTIEQNDGQPSRGEVDSPTLGPEKGGLSGLVRQHLRNVSNVSSVYPASVAPQDGLGISQNTRDSFSVRIPSTYSHSNPWDLEDLDTYHDDVASINSGSVIDPNQPKIAPLATPTPGIMHPQPRVQEPQQTHIPEWQQELRKHQHARGASTETQHEREAFANEMMQRQKAIQESMRNKAESESRSASPSGVNGPRRALNMLRAKSSRDSMATPMRADGPPKAMKMLGIGAPNNASSASLSRVERSQDSDIHPLERVGRSKTEPDFFAPQPRPSVDTVRERRPTAPNSAQSSIRNRSSSELSNGSDGRSGLNSRERPMVSVARSARPSVDDPPPMPPPRADTAPMGHGPPRGRSHSRPVPKQGYFDQRTLHPIHTGTGNLPPPPRLSPGIHAGNSPGVSPGTSPRPSPGMGPLPSPGTSIPGSMPSPVPSSVPRQSPMTTPYSANSTPPLSAATTPGSQFGSTTSANTTSRFRMPRKGSIQKSDISEPTLISQTSVMDTRELPAGASLRNGQDEPPPVPPINPRRRRFGFGRQGSQEQSRSGAATPTSAEPMSARSEEEKHRPRRLRKMSSEGKSLQDLSRPSNTPPSPAHKLNFISRPRPVDGAMF